MGKTPKRLEIQRKLNDSLKGGDWVTIDELVENFSHRDLAEKLLKYVGKIQALKEINQMQIDTPN